MKRKAIFINGYGYSCHGLEGQGFHVDGNTTVYNLPAIAKTLNCSSADFAAVGDFIVCWAIAVHGRGD